jgi:hypothetical protein
MEGSVKKIRVLTVLVLMAGLLMGSLNPALAAPDAPPTPSSFYGEIQFVGGDGEPIEGDYVEAYVPGVTGYVARTAIQTYEENLVYAINVPGDDSETAGVKEGGVENDVVTFKIAGRIVATGTWHTGTNVNLVLHPPSADAGGPYSGEEGSAINFSASAEDVGDDVATYQWDWNNDGTYDETAQSTSQTWSSDGTYTVGLKVTDEQGGEGITTVEVTVTNAAPVLTPIGAKTVNELVELAFTAIASDNDPPLTYSLVGAPAGAAITSGGDFTWTPNEAQGPGSYPVTVKVCDSGTPQLCDEEEITITVSEVNVAPVLDAVGSKSVNELVLLTFTATATDGDVPANTLTFSLAAGTGGAVPAGAAITSGGVFTWTPTEAQGPGPYTFDVCVSDGALSDCETITVTVNEVNVAPVLNAVGSKSVNELALLTFTATATDGDVPANTLTFSLVGEPTGAAITSGGVFTWTPTEDQGPNDYTFTVKVCDNGTPSLCDEEEITVTVNDTIGTHSLTLLPGWNLVSFNVHPTDTDPEVVLSSIAGNYDLVYAWDATGGHSGGGNWMKHDNIPQTVDSLTALDEKMGFWIHITSVGNQTLNVTGSRPTTTNIDLLDDVGGWNLVGFPAVAGLALPGALESHGVVEADYTLVYAYHAVDAADPWKLYDNAAPDYANDLKQMDPGWGYWIFVTADSIWDVAY